jgi:glycosyltransferase involved in cell wall biosynthesis
MTSRTLRVAVVHNLKPGGAHRRLREQAGHLDCVVREFTLSTAEPVTRDAVVSPVSMTSPEAPRWRRPLQRYVDLHRLVAAWERCFGEVDRWKPDVVWLNPCQFLQAPAVPRSFAVPTVYYCDEPRRADYEPAVFAQTNPSTRAIYAPLRRRERSLDRATVRRVTRIATNSRYSAAAIRSAYGRRATRVGCGVEAGFTPLRDDVRPVGHVLCVGALIPSKGHDLAIAAVARGARDLPLVVVAPRPDATEERRLRDLATVQGVELRIVTAISDDELIELYRHALATVYLARAEPLGLVSLEAQACGCPVVVADEGGLPETVVDGGSGWTVERNAAEAGDRLRRLRNETLRASMAAAAARNGAAQSWSDSAQQVHLLLDSVAPAVRIVQAAA